MIGNGTASGRVRVLNQGHCVCDRCVEIDNRTERYRELAKFVSDTAALESIARLIEGLATEKLDLHPRPKE